MPLGSIFVRFGADLTDLDKGISTAQRKLRGFEASVGAIASGLITLAAPIAALGIAAIRSSSRLEQLKIGFGGLLKDGAKVQLLMEDLRRLSARTPFSVPELGEAARTLISLGLGLEEALELLPIFVDTLSAMGRTGPDAIFRLSKAFTDIRAKGRLAAQEINQLAELGIPIREILQKELGVTAQRLLKMQEAGIPAARVLGVLVSSLKERFGGAAEASLGAIGNQIRQVRNEIDLLLADLGDELAPTVKELLVIFRDDFLPVIKDLIKGFGDLSPETKRWTVELTLLLTALGPILFALRNISALLRTTVVAHPFISGAAAAVVGMEMWRRSINETSAELRKLRDESEMLEDIGKQMEQTPFRSRLFHSAEELRQAARALDERAMRRPLMGPPSPEELRRAVEAAAGGNVLGDVDQFQEIEEFAAAFVGDLREGGIVFDEIGAKLEGFNEELQFSKDLAGALADPFRESGVELARLGAEAQLIQQKIQEIAQASSDPSSILNDERIKKLIEDLGLASEAMAAITQEITAAAVGTQILSAAISTGLQALASAVIAVAAGTATLQDAFIGALQSILSAIISIISQLIAELVIQIVLHGGQTGGFIGALVAVGLAAVAVSAALAMAKSQSSKARSSAKSFAEGGIAHSPMLAMVGDAPRNRGPEVISPLEDLRDMLGLGSGQIQLNVYIGEERIGESLVRILPRQLKVMGIRI